jgi:16S rRNA processing protein RimM
VSGLPDRVAVGRVRGLHGLRGAVRVEVLTDHPADRFAEGATVLAGDRALTVAEFRPVPGGRGILVRFREVADRDAAESLRDLDLEVEVDPERDLEDDEVFWHELQGLRVTAADGRDLGTVRYVYRAGEAEVLSVDGGEVRPFELPVVRAFLVEWAPRDGRIVVDADALGVEPLPPARPPRPPRTPRTPRAPRRPGGARGGAADPAPAVDPAPEPGITGSAGGDESPAG